MALKSKLIIKCSYDIQIIKKFNYFNIENTVQTDGTCAILVSSFKVIGPSGAESSFEPNHN